MSVFFLCFFFKLHRAQVMLKQEMLKQELINLEKHSKLRGNICFLFKERLLSCKYKKLASLQKPTAGVFLQDFKIKAQESSAV